MKKYKEEKNEMKKHKVEKLKWYKPFKVMKKNNELEMTINELFKIINAYSDELCETKNKLNDKNDEIKNLEKIIQSAEEDYKALLCEIQLKPRTKKEELL